MKISPSTLSLVCGYFSILLGSLVILGWFINSHYLIQTFQNYVPMQFNTALGFVLGGIGILFSNNSKILKAHITSFILLAVGSLTLLQYVFNVDLEIDQLFFHHHITINTSHPGRMAPNTAICLILTSLSLFAISKSKGNLFSNGILFSGISGGIISSLGLIAFLGYLTNVEPAYGWGDHTMMALHTAIGFFIQGIGITAFAWKNEPNKIFGSPKWFPFLLTAGEITFSLFYSDALSSEEKPYLSTIVLNAGIFLVFLTNFAIFFFRKHKSLLEKQLIDFHQKSKTIEHQIQSVRQDDRADIAREIHDDLGQSLTVLKLGLSRLQEKFPQSKSSLQNEIRPMIAVIDDAIKCIQRIATNLRPPVLDELGFLDAVSLRIGLFKSNSKIHCEMDFSPECNHVNRELALALFRIIQEALTNISRHSKANKVKITLGTKNKFIFLKIVDNGIGIRKDHIDDPKSLGILGIRERVKILKGEFDIIGIPKDGTRLEIKIPLEEK